MVNAQASALSRPVRRPVSSRLSIINHTSCSAGPFHYNLPSKTTAEAFQENEKGSLAAWQKRSGVDDKELIKPDAGTKSTRES